MKFLCVECDAQMKIIKSKDAITPNMKGSLSIRYECPECLTQIAMLTNPFETQLVTSLGVEIGGKTVSPTGGITVDEGGSTEPKVASATVNGEEKSVSKCPFSHMARKTMLPGLGEQEDGIQWTAQALVRLNNIPEFVRPMAKQGIEKFAGENGFAKVDESCMDAAKVEFDM